VKPCEIQAPRGNRHKSTIFGQQWLIAVVDEAHTARNLSKVFFAAQNLRRSSSFLVAMTATPVNTKLQASFDHVWKKLSLKIRTQDLWNLGRILDIYTHEHDTDCRKLVTEVAKAGAADRKILKENSEGAERVTRIARGEQVDDDSETKDVVVKWLKRIRHDYKGHIIRRTGDSKDNNGKSVSDIIPMQEHRLVVSLYPAEQKHIEHIAERLSKDKPQGGAMFAGGKVSFKIIPNYNPPLRTPHCVQLAKVTCP
jgi:superfamily II DNA or RNA helicase